MSGTTQQVDDKSKSVPNPTGKGGFGDNPQNRNPGGWDKTGSISYQYNRLIRMTDAELKEFKNRMDRGECTQAEKIGYQRVKDANKDLQTTKEITDRTEGKAPQAIEFTNPDGSMGAYAALSPDELRKLADSK